MGSITECSAGNAASYRISKAALNMLCMSMSNESRVANCGARVLVLHPGWVDTDMGSSGKRKPPLSVEQSTSGIINIINKAVKVQRSNVDDGSSIKRTDSTSEKEESDEDDIERIIRSSNCTFLQYDGETISW
jgi:NAD(P)-dependent dehydrogenase (short-subunit alcohol dehydrogenase family)